MVPTDNPNVQGIIDDHERLRDVLAQLRGYLEAPQPELGGEDREEWAATLSDHVYKLHGRLRAHFRHEDESGIIEDLEVSYPRAARKLAQVHGEHDQILSDLRTVLNDTMAFAAGLPSAAPGLRERLLAILNHLSSHEQREVELVQSVLYTDIGAGD
jgi:iron-sulfur cluster repair protein YtfE (RIC family)